ncbi:hypothetical protein LK09_15290 [Microbacterium mangrovi]|uniref:Alcohol dehydrogenase iron-type/glycerol dehydrogenase GldA domain-containing protein n=1 Tax=Microbacterium mangrovi TaxID=1348253 RepID=A0A0B2A454_9MICO|nr:iron-containing alcohol dehydrogenase [Microbacterium mangrovi]KHK96353.1 hypothetical protein LK09_15290 [Microbacterium mangrovi]
MIPSTPVARGPAPAQLVGTGAVRAAIASLGISHPVVFVDANTTSAADTVLGGCPALSPADRIVVDAPIGWTQIESFARIVRDAAPDALLAIGGGNTMDAAKLSGWCAAADRTTGALRARSQLGGLLFAGRADDLLPLVCAPTTVGTGAEVSSVACTEVRLGDDSFKCLVGFEQSTVRAAAYDPRLLDVPRRLLTAGIAEAWIRVLGAFVGASSSIPGSDQEAIALIGRLASIAERTHGGDDPDQRVVADVALASAATHTGWALRGRGLAPSPLWFIANELSMMASVSKMEATQALLPGWLRSVSTGDSAWGAAPRVHQALEASGCDRGSDLAARIRALVGAPRITFDARRLADRVVARFGGGRPLPRALTRTVIARMVAPSADDEKGGSDAAD